MFSTDTDNPLIQNYGIIKETVITTTVNAIIINESLVQTIKNAIQESVVHENETLRSLIASIDFIVICYALDAYEIDTDTPAYIKTILAKNIKTTNFGVCTLKELIVCKALPYMRPCTNLQSPESDYCDVHIQREVVNGKLILES